MDQYLIYLRKSRKDREVEQQTGSFDTLQRHRDTLLSLARSRGYYIAHIYEEVVSGDTIAERPEMQKLLAAVETGAFAGVLVMEIPRLARGNTRDQGTVSETFQYSGTRIITPEKTYNPADEADEEYFEFGLFMSRREYKAINRRLQRGRMASLNEGKYIAGSAPYGYKRVRIPQQRGYTLEIIPEKADIVCEIFSLYTKGTPSTDGTIEPVGSYGIANMLNARGILSPGGVKWTASAVRDILKNPTYAGYVRWAYRPDKKQMSDGYLVVTHPINKEAPLHKGLHPALIDESTWSAAKAAMAQRSHPPVPGQKRVANPLAGLLRCSVCGRTLVQLPQGNHGAPLLLCPTAKCPTVSSRRDTVEAALLNSLRNWLENYKLESNHASQAEDEDAKVICSTELQIEKLCKNLEALDSQRENLYDLLEQKIYDQETFLERSRTLSGRISDIEVQIKNLSSYLTLLRKTTSTRKDLLPHVQNVIEVYNTLNSPSDKNALLRAVLDHVTYSKSTGGKWKESDLTLCLYPKLPNVS